jgi:hypothetical protein
MSTTNYTNALWPELETPAVANALLVHLSSSTVLALTLHHLVFRKGEWHLKAPVLFGAWMMSYPLLFTAELVLGRQSFGNSAAYTLITMGSFTVVMFASIAVYRLFFHRLGSFPGPTMAKVTKLWHAGQCLDGKNHLVLDILQQQYGDYVRTGEIWSLLKRQ